MQKLSSIVKNRENQNNGDDNNKRPRENTKILVGIHPEIVFLISRFKFNNYEKYLAVNKAKDITFCAPNRFSYDFTFYKKIRSINIKQSCLVNLNYFEGLEIKNLEFDKINTFEITNLKNIKVYKLSLRNINISLKNITNLIKIFSPKLLELSNIQLLDQKCIRQELKFYKMLLNLNLYDFQVENCFISSDRFFDFVCKKNIQKFKYEFNNTIVKYRNIGVGFSYFIVKNFQFSKFFNPLWLFVEIISTDFNKLILNNINKNNKRIKFLCLENIKLDTITIRSFPKLSSIYINNCDFENLSFYEFINSQKETLKFISFSNCNIPLDGISYIFQSINDCKVVNNSINIKY